MAAADATPTRDANGEFPPLRGLKLVLLTIAVAVSTFMEILDMTIVNVSVPSIAGSLGVSPSEGTWSISSYMLAAAVVQPLAGWIGRRFGEVRTFVWSILLFVVFSALCGLATSMPMLIAGRLMQGLVVLHLAAIVYYAVRRREDLVRPMITGVRRFRGPVEGLVRAPLWRLAVGVLIGVAVGYAASRGFRLR